MEIKTCVKESFSVIGKEGSTKDGAGFVQKLWEDANSHFNEIAHLAKKRMNMEISAAYGEQCLTFLALSNHGGIILRRDCTWRAWRLQMKPNLRQDG